MNQNIEDYAAMSEMLSESTIFNDNIDRYIDKLYFEDFGYYNTSSNFQN